MVELNINDTDGIRIRLSELKKKKKISYVIHMRSSNTRHGEVMIEKGVTCMFWLKGLRMLGKGCYKY
jgi:hypothetical protein